MAVVIDEFEAVAEGAAPPHRPADGAEGDRGNPRARIEADYLAEAAFVLAQRTLRSWAH